MKRHRSSADSTDALASICPNSTSEGNNPIIRDFETLLEGMDDEGCSVEETCPLSEKKRRLSIDQVRALERNFELENKLDPERKVKLAREVGLEPRQVAVWFQNRRARSKTKQLERDYVSLKGNYDGLRLSVEKLRQENESLLREIRELKSKLCESSPKQEEMLSDTEVKTQLETPNNDKLEEGVDELKFDKFSEAILNMKDGSDSDSSAILNEENSNPSSRGDSCNYNTSFYYSGNVMGDHNRVYFKQQQQQQPFVKMEEQDFFGEECCSSLIFSEDQAPTLHWYFE